MENILDLIILFNKNHPVLFVFLCVGIPTFFLLLKEIRPNSLSLRKETFGALVFFGIGLTVICESSDGKRTLTRLMDSKQCLEKTATSQAIEQNLYKINRISEEMKIVEKNIVIAKQNNAKNLDELESLLKQYENNLKTEQKNMDKFRKYPLEIMIISSSEDTKTGAIDQYGNYIYDFRLKNDSGFTFKIKGCSDKIVKVKNNYENHIVKK